MLFKTPDYLALTIEQTGSIEELFYHPQNEYIGTFLGIPKMLLYKYKVSVNSTVQSFMGYTFTLEKMSIDTIDIGIRASDFVFYEEGRIVAKIVNKSFNGSIFIYRCSAIDYDVFFDIISPNEYRVNDKKNVIVKRMYFFDGGTKKIINIKEY